MNADFQRLLDDMDRALRRKHQELSELDERLETARRELSEKEAKDILSNRDSDAEDDRIKQQDFGVLLQEQRDLYEAKISNLTAELIGSENSNQNLLRVNGQLRFEIDSLRVSNEKLKNRAQTLNDDLDETQSANFELNIRLAKAESQVQMQQNLLIKSHEQDQILMSAFNSKLETLNEAISRRDDEISRLREWNKRIVRSESHKEDEASDANQINDPQNLDAQGYSINFEPETRDNAIQQSEQLAQIDGHAGSSAIESSNDKKVHSICGKSNEEVQKLEMRSKMLEVELDEKDRLLHWTEKRIHYLEFIFPEMIVNMINALRTKFEEANIAKMSSGITPATGRIDVSVMSLISDLSVNLDKLLSEFKSNRMLLNTVDQLEATLLSKDEHIKRLVRELNVIDAKMDNDQIDASMIEHTHEVDSLQYPLSDRHLIRVAVGTDSHGNIVKSETAEEHERAEVTLAEIPTDEKPQHPNTSSIEAHQSSANTVASLKTVDNESDYRGTGDDRSKVEDDDVREPSLSDNQLDASESRIIEGSGSDDRKDHHLSETRLTDSHLIGYENRRMQQLEEENQMLELAMKEILLSIKWSDTKCSTILIDCPSLERLCQLIEARYLSSVKTLRPDSTEEMNLSQNCDLFQFVVMKSELDILRGQNEQLRTDLKLIRQDNQLVSTKELSRIIPTKRAVSEQDVVDEFGRCEIECQTDSLILISPENLSLMHERSQSQEILDDKNSPDKKGKCQNCIRLVRLANHLLDCIVRIEDRVNSSDESYISRLMALYQLIQRLSKELSSKDSTINQLRRENHNMNQRRAHTEARCRAIENNFEIHNRVCPLSYTSPRNSHKLLRPSNRIPIEMNPSLTIRTNQDQVEVPLRDGRITIALLQSIIGCLQARLDYKDERLAQLEQMLVSG